jgi:DNA modification methylase
LRLDPLRTMAEIAANGFTQHRDVTRHFAAKLRVRESRQALAGSSMACAGEWFNRCYHAQFQSLIGVFPDSSIKILHADPPYANYRSGDGEYRGGSVTRTDCDGATATEAVEMTVDLLRDWGPKLCRGGLLLLWQASGPLRKPITEAVDEFGWAVESVVIWNKGRVQAGNFERPYSTQTEWLWVLKHAGDRLINHDNSPRGDVLHFAPVCQAAETADHQHAFEKPISLCEFLVGKHSYEGELVVDLCACTGSMSVAAAQMNRRWVYIESNPTNYQIGSGRIARELAVNQSMAS